VASQQWDRTLHILLEPILKCTLRSRALLKTQLKKVGLKWQ